MARRWVGRMWFLLVCNGLASSVDGRLQSAGMFKNEYWFRVVSVPGMHKTSGFRHRSHYQDPNRMATAVKWRHTAPTASEDDEKANIAGDQKISAGSSKHRTTIISNWHIIAELQRLCLRAHLLTWFLRLVQSEYRFFRYFTDAWNIHQQDDFIFRNV